MTSSVAREDSVTESSERVHRSTSEESFVEAGSSSIISMALASYDCILAPLLSDLGDRQSRLTSRGIRPGKSLWLTTKNMTPSLAYLWIKLPATLLATASKA